MKGKRDEDDELPEVSPILPTTFEQTTKPERTKKSKPYLPKSSHSATERAPDFFDASDATSTVNGKNHDALSHGLNSDTANSFDHDTHSVHKDIRKVAPPPGVSAGSYYVNEGKSYGQITEHKSTMGSEVEGDTAKDHYPTGPMAWVGFGLGLFALTCLCISFCSPYWLQAYKQSNSEFVSMGLWEVCFDGYMHYKDDSLTVYSGCFWVFRPEQKYSKLYEWLTPPWFITVQVLVTLALLAHVAAIFIIILVFLHMCPTERHGFHQTYAMYAAAGLCFFIALLTAIVGVMYGLMCGARAWMPRPDLNFISWGYGFWIIQGIFTVAEAVCYVIEAQNAFNYLDAEEAYREEAELEELTKSQLGGFPSQPSFTEPPYGASSYVGQMSVDPSVHIEGPEGYSGGAYATDPAYQQGYGYDYPYPPQEGGYDPNTGYPYQAQGQNYPYPTDYGGFGEKASEAYA